MTTEVALIVGTGVALVIGAGVAEIMNAGVEQSEFRYVRVGCVSGVVWCGLIGVVALLGDAGVALSVDA
jgi:hypothetical protein